MSKIPDKILKTGKATLNTSVEKLNRVDELGTSDNFIKMFIYNYYKKDIPTYAQALAYISVISTIPVLVVLFSVLNLIGQEKYLFFKKYVLVNILNISDPEVVRTILAVTTSAHNVYVSAIGIVMLFWAVYSVFSTLEDIFSKIWGLGSNSFGTWRRTPLYLLFLMLLPFPIIFAFEFSSALLSTEIFSHWFDRIPYVRRLLIPSASIIILASTVFLMYRFILPERKNTNMFRNDIIGASFVGVAYTVVKYVFIWYVQHTVRLGEIYGPLISIILFIFWNFITWLIILIGLLLSYLIYIRIHPIEQVDG